ncbi:MAG: hypothetical protein AAFQ36_10645 [Pseudomonadota bacterium]
MRRLLREFVADTRAAVTVDYLVLSAAIVLMVISAMFSIRDDAAPLGPALANSITERHEAMFD